MSTKLGKLSLCLSLATAVWATSIPNKGVYGEYVEARTADVYTGPCFANAEVGLTGNLAVFGWKVTQGSWQGVKLDGLAVVGVVRASWTLGDIHHTVYPVKSVLIVDERATPEQRLALHSFARRAGGDLLQDVVKVYYQPISLSFEDGNLHSMKGSLTTGGLATIETRPISEGDHICHNEEVWYQPLTKLDHAMPAVASAHGFRGEGLGATWSNPGKRSAFVGSFSIAGD